jgi:hypothetical protein
VGRACAAGARGGARARARQERDRARGAAAARARPADRAQDRRRFPDDHAGARSGSLARPNADARARRATRSSRFVARPAWASAVCLHRTLPELLSPALCLSLARPSRR